MLRPRDRPIADRRERYRKPGANGMGTEEITEAYPYLEPEDVRQALQYVVWLAEEAVHALEPVVV